MSLIKEEMESLSPEERFEWCRKQMPAAEKYIYMNSGGCGPMPVPVWKSMEDVFERMVSEGQVNVEIHGWLKELLEEVRKSVADFIHAEPEEIFFVRCIAEGLNTIVRMFDWEPEERVLISDQENPASILPFYAAEPILKLHTDMFSGIGNQEQIVEQFSEKLTSKTKMAVVSHVFHTNGTVIPAACMCRQAAEKNVITVLDGAQAAGNVPIDVKELGCDFYLLSCHKWLCGPEGIGAVYIRKDLIPNVKVPFGGVGMQTDFDVESHRISYMPDARRFEYGGRHIPMYAAFRECIRLADAIGMEHITNRTRHLHGYCRGCMEKLGSSVEILSPEDERLWTAIFALRIPGRDHREIVRRAWEEERMIIQWRTVDLKTKEEGLRISLNWFIREQDIDRLAAFLKKVIEE